MGGFGDGVGGVLGRVWGRFELGGGKKGRGEGKGKGGKRVVYRREGSGVACPLRLSVCFVFWHLHGRDQSVCHVRQPDMLCL